MSSFWFRWLQILLELVLTAPDGKCPDYRTSPLAGGQILKQTWTVLGILMVFGCADDSKQDQFESGCAESPSDGGSAVSSGGSGSGGGTDTSTPETCEYYSYY